MQFFDRTKESIKIKMENFPAHRSDYTITDPRKFPGWYLLWVGHGLQDRVFGIFPKVDG
jgi:hypothetical protein